MKKSNKISVFYFLSSGLLLIALIFGGVYGIYISVGLNFVKGNSLNVAETMGRASNVSFGGSVNFESSMSGIIILSIALIVLGVFDIVTLFKQVVFFKQFKTIKNSTLEQVIERKIKSKKGVIVFVFIIDILSVVTGVIGIFLNARTFAGINNIWLLYIIDGLVVIFAVMSLVLLIMKLRKLKRNNNYNLSNYEKSKPRLNEDCEIGSGVCDTKQEILDVDELEYSLLKLKYLKLNKFINVDEFEELRKRIVNIEKKNECSMKEKNKAN
ncbi:MAG: hypothetical protein J6J33_01760 [Clostridia bacterium]|nr:hypothetical protein [Clostridia bacterium]